MSQPPLPVRLARSLVHAPKRRLIGWVVVAVGVYFLVAQLRTVVKKDTGLPDIRHPVYWHHHLYEQALANRNPTIATEIAPFYLIARELAGAKIIVGRTLAGWSWQLGAIGRTRVILSWVIGELPGDGWKDLEPRASHTITLGKRPLYLFVDPNVETYVFVGAHGDTAPLYIVPESIYRSRVADKSGANLSAP
jgi:hypothetical protein